MQRMTTVDKYTAAEDSETGPSAFNTASPWGSFATQPAREGEASSVPLVVAHPHVRADNLFGLFLEPFTELLGRGVHGWVAHVTSSSMLHLHQLFRPYFAPLLVHFDMARKADETVKSQTNRYPDFVTMVGAPNCSDVFTRLVVA